MNKKTTFATITIAIVICFLMSIVVFARYEICPTCEVRLVVGERRRKVGSQICEYYPNLLDPIIGIFETEECPDCGAVQDETLIRTYVDCHH